MTLGVLERVDARPRFEHVTPQWIPSGLAVARRLVPHDEAQDVVQESLLRLWCRWNAVKNADHGRKLFHVIVRGVSVDTLRSAYMRHCIPCDEFAPDALGCCESAADTVLRGWWREALLADLPKTLRDALRAHLMCEVSLREVAAALGLPPETLRTWKHRAMDEIRETARELGPPG